MRSDKIMNTSNPVEKMFQIFVALLALLACLTPTSLIAQDQPDKIEIAKPGISYEQRIDIAKKLLEEVRQKATSDLKSPERKHYFTQHWAKIDPDWTAKFILESPVPQDTEVEEEQILYDSNAIVALMSRPTEIDENTLLKLMENSSQFMLANYANQAIKNLPATKSELKEKIIKLGTRSMDPKMMSPMMFGNRLALAKLSKDTAVLKQVEESIANYYESGQAAKTWKLLQKQDHFRNNRDHFESLFSRYAPESMREEFGGKSQTTFSAANAYMLLNDQTMSQIEKAMKLNELKKHSYGTQPHEQMSAASSLGLVATIDSDLALKWAELAPAEQVRIWARMTIAPSIAKHDLPAARKMVTESYTAILKLDFGDRNRFNYNHSPPALAGRGLRIVEAVDPDLLSDCIDKTIQAIEGNEVSRSSTAQDHIYQAIAAIAPYDKKKAELVFEKYADDVQLYNAAAFFRALVAIHPDQVLDEYQEMPKKNSQGTDYRIYVRNELLPALTAKSDRGFWNSLNNSGVGAFDSKILGN